MNRPLLVTQCNSLLVRYRLRQLCRFLVFAFGLMGSYGSVCLGAERTEAQQDELHFRTLLKDRDRNVEIAIDAGEFIAREHQVKIIAGEKWVDGFRAVGIDGSANIETEIKQFDITWDGKRVPVPKAAYASLFNFSLRRAEFFPGEIGELLVTKSTTDDALLFIFARGDGVREWVWLVVFRNGKWVRFHGSEG